MYHVYVLRSLLKPRYYIGTAKDPNSRLTQHNGGGTASTEPYRPWELVYTEPFETLAEARARERQIKGWKNPAYMAGVLDIK